MLKVKRSLSGMVVLMMVFSILSLTGCTGNSTTPDTTQGTQQEASQEKKEPVEITLWTSPDWKGVYDQNAEGANYGDFFKFAANDFIKENSNVKINVEVVPGAQRDEKFSVAIQSHTQPDIYIDADFVMYDYAHAGLLVPLNDIITEEDRKDIPVNIFDAVTSNGDVYVFPLFCETGHLAINVSLFKEAGAEAFLPKGDIGEWTPEQFRDALRAVKKLDGVYPFGFFCGNTQGDTYNRLFLTMFGGELFNAEGTEVTINSPEGVKAMDFLKGMKDEGLFAPGAESLNVLDAMQMFINKKVAVSVFNNVNYDLLTTGLKDGTIEAPFEFQIANLPNIGQPANYAYDKGSIVFQSGNELRTETAKQFVKFYSSAPYADASLNMMPLRKSVAEKIQDPVKKKIAESAKYAASFSGKAPGYLKLRASFFPELQACITGQKTAQEAMDSYAKTANEILKKGAANSTLLKNK